MDIFTILGRGYDSNIYVIVGSNPTIVDTGTGFYSNDVISVIRKFVDPTTIKNIILTHEHYDHVGGALDTLLSGKGSEIQRQRIEQMLKNLCERLSKIESAQVFEPTEEFYDLSLSIFDGAVKSRSKEKRDRFASILVNQVKKEAKWDESEMAVRILVSLEDIHIQVLALALSAPECTLPFEGLKVMTLKNRRSRNVGEFTPLCLSTHFSDYTTDALRLICSELISKGLLHDEGVGRLDTKAMEYFVATNLADWFLSWITDENT